MKRLVIVIEKVKMVKDWIDRRVQLRVWNVQWRRGVEKCELREGTGSLD